MGALELGIVGTIIGCALAYVVWMFVRSVKGEGERQCSGCPPSKTGSCCERPHKRMKRT